MQIKVLQVTLESPTRTCTSERMLVKHPDGDDGVGRGGRPLLRPCLGLTSLHMERGPRPPFCGGRRGGYRDSEFGDNSKSPPRRTYERHSGTGRGYEMKREGAGCGNWGTSTDEILARETEEALKLDEKAPIPEKQGALEDPPQAEESKDNKDAIANEEEEKEMTLEEFEKLREEKRKALLGLKTEERKVEVDNDLQSMQPLSAKKGNDDVFIKLGSD